MINDCLHPGTCARCHQPMRVHTMSKYNKDVICMACKNDERTLPSYLQADRAECDAVRQGNYNFSGVGLSPDDVMRLAELRRKRAQKT